MRRGGAGARQATVVVASPRGLGALHPGPDFGVLTAASLAGIGPDTAGPVLDRLVDAHLVTEDGAGQFRMHDLLRLFARSTCQETGDRAQGAAEARLVR